LERSSSPLPITVGLHRWFVICGLVIAGLNGCSGMKHRPQDAAPPLSCTKFDSLYSHALYETPFRLLGKAKFDLSQHQLRGRFDLAVSGEGTTAFDFVSSSLFGAHREEVTLYLTTGTLRIIDRERDLFYEGEDADAYIMEILETDRSILDILSLILRNESACGRFDSMSLEPGKSMDKSLHIYGMESGEPVRFTISRPAGKVVEITWPVQMMDGSREILQITFDWRRTGDGGNDEELREITLYLEKRSWRLKLTVSERGQ
jgi:hypothetical protein